MKWVVVYLGVVCSFHRLTGGYSVDQNHSVPISKEYVHLFTHGFRNLCLFSVLVNPGVSKCWILFLFLDQNDAAKSRP